MTLRVWPLQAQPHCLPCLDCAQAAQGGAPQHLLVHAARLMDLMAAVVVADPGEGCTSMEEDNKAMDFPLLLALKLAQWVTSG